MEQSPVRIGCCLSLSGALASNGKTAPLTHQIWRENVTRTALFSAGAWAWSAAAIRRPQVSSLISTIAFLLFEKVEKFD